MISKKKRSKIKPKVEHKSTRQIIVFNAIRCKVCNDVIVSDSVHDFKTCKCGKVSVDGGHDYLRRCGDLELMEDLSKVEEIL